MTHTAGQVVQTCPHIFPLTPSPDFPTPTNHHHPLPAGAGQISGTGASLQHAIVLGPGDHLTATATAAAAEPAGGDDADDFASGAADHGLKFLLMAGRPIDEPIVQQG